MPLHDFQCPTGHITEDYVAHGVNSIKCRCGQAAEKVFLRFPAAFVQAEVRYDSPIDGRVIGTKQARIEDLKRSGSRPWEGLHIEKQEAARQDAYADKKLDDSLAKTAAETFYQLPPSKREILTKGV